MRKRINNNIPTMTMTMMIMLSGRISALITLAMLLPLLLLLGSVSCPELKLCERVL